MGLLGAKFVVTEIVTLASKNAGSTPAVFTWDVEHRNMPEGAWEYGITQRTNRVDYPGGDNPTEQVLGPNYEPFTFAGQWDDKWNSPHYAEQTRKDFESLVRRGNLVKITCNDLTFVGIIKNVRLAYKNPYRCRYSFTVSPHDRGSDSDELRQGPDRGQGDQDARTRLVKLQAQHEQLQDAMTSQQAFQSADKPVTPSQGPDIPTMPEESQASQVQGDILGLSTALGGHIDDAFAALDKAVLSPVTDTLTALKTLAANFAIARGRCQQVLDTLSTVRSDTQTIHSAVALTQWESWKRGVAYQARLMWNTCWDAEVSLGKQAQPDILALYQAQPNESLYHVALRFYGTPTAWKIIAERNNISGFILNGGELLVIPQGPRR